MNHVTQRELARRSRLSPTIRAFMRTRVIAVVIGTIIWGALILCGTLLLFDEVSDSRRLAMSLFTSTSTVIALTVATTRWRRQMNIMWRDFCRDHCAYCGYVLGFDAAKCPECGEDRVKQPAE